jgi:hypothetical protein
MRRLYQCEGVFGVVESQQVSRVGQIKPADNQDE